MPLYNRLLTAAAVRLEGRTYFFDGGEGVQISCKNVHLGFRAISVISVSHLHADHCLGVPGVLMMRARSEDPEPLTILGPPGIERFIQDIRRDLGFYINYDIRFNEWNKDIPPGDVAYQDEFVKIRWALMKHTTTCLGYTIEEHERPGRFNVGKAIELGVPRGPAWGKLQKGESVTLENGVTITPEEVLGAPRSGRRVAYLTDTLANKNMYKLLSGADLAFIEGMFHSSEAEMARSRMHLTAREAGRLCKRSGVGRAVLIHISPRYENSRLPVLEEDAREEFAAAEMGKVGVWYSIPFAND